METAFTEINQRKGDMQLAMVGDARALETAADVGSRYDVGRLAAALAARGHDVRVYTPTRAADPPPRVPGATVVPIRLDVAEGADSDVLMPRIGAIGRFLVDEWARRPSDVVFGHGWECGLAAQLAARRYPIPTVQSFPQLRGTGSVGRLEMLLARSATRVAVACAEDLDTVVALSRARRRVSVLPNGIDTDAITTGDIAAARGARARRIIAVAQDFSPGQGLADAVRALPAVPGAELTLVTPAGPPDRHERAVLDLIERVEVCGRVAVEQAHDAAELCRLLRGADVVVCPAHRDELGSMVLHAMACGVAVIAAGAGGARDIVVDEVTGLLVRPGDVATLSRTLRRSLGQSALRQGMGLAARSRVRSRYSWDRVATDAELVLAGAADSFSTRTAAAR